MKIMILDNYAKKESIAEIESIIMPHINWDVLNTQVILDVIKHGNFLRKSVAFKQKFKY
jgi:hypothetical protein